MELFDLCISIASYNQPVNAILRLDLKVGLSNQDLNPPDIDVSFQT